jgi:RNA 3'-terminal phosphate cyclase (ATP)
MPEQTIYLNGSHGEGGGQILRTALALSLHTQKAFYINNIRGGRAKPGLLRQHLACVQAAAALSNAEVEGAELSSQTLSFRPRGLSSGKYHFSVGSAGSTSLVLQSILPALILANGPSEILIEGGTHNPMAPPFPFLEKTYLPLLERMGPKVAAHLESVGFAPWGGGAIRVFVEPCKKLRPLSLEHRGEFLCKQAFALMVNLGNSIAMREFQVLRQELGDIQTECQVEKTRQNVGAGNMLWLELESESVTEVISALGERGVRAEDVAQYVVREAREYIDANVPVGQHLADQLLLLLALAGGGSFLTIRPTEHTRTQIETIQNFLSVNIVLTPSMRQNQTTPTETFLCQVDKRE